MISIAALYVDSFPTQYAANVRRVSYRLLSQRLRLHLMVTIMLLACWPCGAQVTDPSVAQQEPIPGSGHDYIGMGAETVNPQDGSVSFNLPIQTPPGRELTLPFSIRFNSAEPFFITNNEGQYLRWTTPTVNKLPAPFSLNGWSYALPFYQAQAYVASVQNYSGVTNYCWSTGSYTFLGLDDILTPLSGQNQWPDPNNPTPGACQQTTYPAGLNGGNGHLAELEAPPPGTVGVQPPLTVTDRSGTTYQFPTGPGISTSPTVVSGGITPFGVLAQSITDRNGNQITLQGTSVYLNGFTLGPGLYKDTLGRPVVSWSGLGSTSGDELTIAGLPGNIAVKWTTITPTLPQHVDTAYVDSCSFGYPVSLSMSVVSEIDLPNGTKYSFSYGGTWGLLDRITFPNGGYVRYVWGTNSASAVTSQSWSYAQNVGSCQAIYDTPAITDRYVSNDGSTEVLHQKFSSYSTTWNVVDSYYPRLAAKNTTMTTYQLNGSSWTETGVTQYSYNFAYGGTVPTQSSVVYQGATNNTLQTVTKKWADAYTVIGEQTVLDNGQGMTTLSCPDQWGNITAVYEYNFQSAGPKPSDPACLGSALSTGLNIAAIGPLMRQTHTAFHNFFGGAPSTKIFNEPDSVTVSDGSGNITKQTSYVYDGAAVVPSGARAGLVAPPGVRGNATSVSQLVGSQSITTNYTYFDTGQIQSKLDPCGTSSCADMAGSNHTTTYSYTDSPSGGNAAGNSNAYVTQVIRPNTGVAHVMSYQYNYPTGELSQTSDENGQLTKYTYNDPLLRLKAVSGPPSPQNGNATPLTSYAYVDGSNASMTTVNPIGVTSETLYDGLDHVAHTILTTDPGGADYVDTTYDGLNHVSSVSNPYRATGNPISSSYPTDGSTTYTYDALGRKTLQVEQDNNSLQWSYSGNVTTFTDENGNKWQRTMDALGRLTKVLEPNGASRLPSMETDYVYDMLDNLLSVTQCGTACGPAGSPPLAGSVVRGFTYDTLSRLITATNPESGATHYSYDANSNLATKTSPAVNASSGTQTVGYCYDALNRMTAKFYTTPPNCSSLAGAVATYAYDSSSISGASNVIGRLTDEKGYIGGALISERTPYAYDPMGRLTAEQQCPFVPACTKPYIFTYAYDLAGNLTSSNNGLPSTLPSLTFGFSYDRAGHMSLAQATSQPWNSATYPLILQQANQTSPAAYDPAGHMVNAQLGLVSTNATPAVTLARQYDNRSRITLEMDDSITFYQVPAGGYDPKGNLLTIKDSVIGNWAFGYDTLNRLTSGVASSGPSQGDYGCWTYDPFGNRTLEALSTVTTTPCAPNSNDNAIFSPLTPVSGTNRMSNFTYDAAGNVLYDGANAYAYDAEGRLCEVAVNLTGQTSYYQYLYDAEGRRVAKGSTTSKSCGAPNSANNFSLTNQYLLGKQGEQVTELAGTNGTVPDHTNVWTSGRLLNTYDFVNGGLHFALNDLVGTKRLQVSGTGVPELTCATLPFGNGVGAPRVTPCLPWQSSTAPDATEHHFTGKERDAESGLDYFGARYYGSSMGRFMTPDEPFANFDQEDPQSLNMYSYVQNGPLSATDPDGHNVQVCVDNGSGSQNCVDLGDDQYKQLYQQQNGQQGINLPGGSMPGGNITCGGSVCGSTQFYERGLQDETGGELMGLAGGKLGGYAFGKVAGWVGSLFGREATQGGGVVLGRTFELGEDALGASERKLNLPDLGDPKSNWAQNSSRLREAMAEGQPIRDAHVDGAGNLIRDNPSQGGGGAFLKAERNLLENHGWTYNPSTTSWYPPNR